MRTFIIIGLLISFSICYMQWGNNNSAFIAQVEYELLFKKKNIVEAISHPIILAGFFGQLILLYSALAKKPNKKLQSAGIILLGIIVLIILLAGILSINLKMILSVMPFILLSIFYFARKK